MSKAYIIKQEHKEEYEATSTVIIAICTTEKSKDKIIAKYVKDCPKNSENPKDYGQTCVEVYVTGSDKYSETRIEVHLLSLNKDLIL